MYNYLPSAITDMLPPQYYRNETAHLSKTSFSLVMIILFSFCCDSDEWRIYVSLFKSKAVLHERYDGGDTSCSKTKPVWKKRKQMRLNTADFDIVSGNNHWLSNQLLPEQHKSTYPCWCIFFFVSFSPSVFCTYITHSKNRDHSTVPSKHFTNFMQIAINRCYAEYEQYADVR